MADTFSVKVNAPEVLERELKRRAKKREYGIITLSSATDAYMQIEEKLGLTRRLLEIILRYRFPVHILTKSQLVLRDLDLLKEIDRSALLPDDLNPRLRRRVIISFSMSTLDEKLAKLIEPGALSPRERLEALKKCKEAGFLVGINCIPVLPFLSDSEEQLENMIKAAKDYEADFVLVGGLTLFGDGSADSKTPYYRGLEKYSPELIRKYKTLFGIFPRPSKEYLNELDKKSKRLSEKHEIKRGIVD